MIKDYLQYLINKPGKLAWIIGVNLILAAICYVFFSNIVEILGDTPLWAIILVSILITAIRIAIDLQPFIEWKDGKDRN